MRAWGLIFGLTLSGCLYLGDVNHVPTAKLTVIGSAVGLIKGQPLTISATLTDPEDGTNLVPQWSIALTDGSQTACDYQLIYNGQVVDGKPTAQVMFFRTGNWLIGVSTVDKLDAAASPDQAMVTVVDAPPTFQPTQDLSAQVNTDPECLTYTAGRVLPLYLAGSVVDPDAVLSPSGACDPKAYNETLTYHWELTNLPASSHAVIGAKPSRGSDLLGDGDCPPSPAPGLGTSYRPQAGDFPTAACAYLDVGGDPVPSMYQIALFASDGTTEIETHSFVASVRSDLPPCLTGATPEPGSHVVDRNAVQELSVTGAVDDLDPFGSDGLGFVWSIWREEDPVWRQVPDWSLPSYSLDTSGFSVGEKVRVRVVPADRLGARASCDVDQDSCAVQSCLTGSTLCQTWMTWDLELR